MNNHIDHFTVATGSLASGAPALAEVLGALIPGGSKHDLMSTHNCVMRAGEGCFIELLAIDPDAADPGRARWFSMDDPATQARIAQRPRALCWVVRTDDLDTLVATSPVDLGEILPFKRGDRSWRITVPKDGHLPGNGLLPAFIEWSPGPHPSAAQQDLGVRLKAIRLTHPDPDALGTLLEGLGVRHLVTIDRGPAALAFELATPKGVVVLD